jgi:hypothetical protein
MSGRSFAVSNARDFFQQGQHGCCRGNAVEWRPWGWCYFFVGAGSHQTGKKQKHRVRNHFHTSLKVRLHFLKSNGWCHALKEPAATKYALF